MYWCLEKCSRGHAGLGVVGLFSEQSRVVSISNMFVLCILLAAVLISDNKIVLFGVFQAVVEGACLNCLNSSIIHRVS